MTTIITQDLVDAATTEQGLLAETAIQVDEYVEVVSVSTAEYDIDFSVSQVYEITLEDDIEFSIINPPTKGGALSVKIIQGSSVYIPTFNINNLSWGNGASPVLPEGNGDYVWVVFVTVDGGTSWTGFVSGAVEV